MEDGKGWEKKRVKLELGGEVVGVVGGMGKKVKEIGKGVKRGGKVGRLGNVEGVKGRREVGGLEGWLNWVGDFLGKEKKGWEWE